MRKTLRLDALFMGFVIKRRLFVFLSVSFKATLIRIYMLMF